MDFDRITEYLNSLEGEGIPSVDCMIYQDHRLIYRHFNGYSDERKKNKIRGDEQYLVFSMTKLITMTSIVQLIEQGKLKLEDPVGDYLPAYRNLTVQKGDEIVPAQTILRIKHLVSMQSGLDYNLSRPGIQRVLKERGEKAATRELVDAFIESPLLFEPGEHFEYSLSHDVVGAIIEVVSGMSLGDYFKRNIFEPLDMKNTFFAKAMNDHPKLADQFIYNSENHTSVKMEPSCVYQLSESYESAGAGLMSCTEDFAAFADMLACGGISANGNRILQESTIELMRTNLLGETQRIDIAAKMGRIGYGYGCGVQILLNPEECASIAPVGIFGWDGAAGSALIADPERRMSLVYMQHVRNCGYAYTTIHPMLRDLLYKTSENKG